MMFIVPRLSGYGEALRERSILYKDGMKLSVDFRGCKFNWSFRDVGHEHFVLRRVLFSLYTPSFELFLIIFQIQLSKHVFR